MKSENWVDDLGPFVYLSMLSAFSVSVGMSWTEWITMDFSSFSWNGVQRQMLFPNARGKETI